QAEGKTLKELTDFYTEAFLQDIKTLGVELPDVMPKATEEIPLMVELIKKLLEKGYAYKTPKGDIYFKISAFPSYGELAKIDLSSLKENAAGRLNLEDEYEKENAADFALWKAWDKEDGEVFWETEIGKGRPGWHIECSAMAEKYLGQPFDIHCGGEDLIFPHHTNEIAQAEAANEKKFANYWLHNAHLIVNGRKMSKSLGNFYTLRDILNKGYKPDVIRYELIKTHYRQQLDFRLEHLEHNRNILNRFKECLERVKDLPENREWSDLSAVKAKALEDFFKAMADDLNISEAIAAVFDFVHKVNKTESLTSSQKEEVKDVFNKFDSVLGVIELSADDDKLTKEIEELIKEREKARKEKNFKRADEIRDLLLSKGIALKDTPQGTKWYKVK
ncbi:MAG: cysteine--tRNA ligase, partial [Candidatus Dadabacteria bacterium]